MFYTKEELQSLTRKELQKLSKQFGIKANRKNCELVSDLVEYFDQLQNEAKSLSEDLELKQWISDDDEPTKTLTTELQQQQDILSDDQEEEAKEEDGTAVTNKSADAKQMKEDLMKEVEKRANANLTKIPRFCASQVTTSMSPASQNLKASQNKQFRKMDSIDVYLEKKRKRTAYQMNCQTKLKEKTEESLKKMKLSHNTPQQTKNITTRKSRGNTPLPPKKNDIKPPARAAAGTSFKVDKEVSFNFVSKLKTPKPITATVKPVLKEKNDKQVTVAGGVGKENIRKSSVQFNKSINMNKSMNKSIIRKSGVSFMADTKSPSVKFGAVSSATKKTPAKFDLQASLKKRLSYKPHTGKLKDTYIEAGGSGVSSTSFNANSTFTMSPKKSVKEMTSKPKVTRANRRAEATKRRGTKRTDALSKRRGIEA